MISKINSSNSLFRSLINTFSASRCCVKSKEVLTNKIALAAFALLLAAVAVRKLHQWCFKHEASPTQPTNAADKPAAPPAPVSQQAVPSPAETEEAGESRTAARFNDASDGPFKELTRRATHDVEQAFIAIITTDESLNTTDLVDYFTTQPWDHQHRVIQDPKQTQVALKAFKEGKITDHQFATICFFACAMKQQKEVRTFEHTPLTPPVRIALFLADGTINPVAYDIISSTRFSALCKRRIPTVSDEVLKKFFELMRSQPASEQQFLLLEYNDNAGNEETIRGVLHAKRSFQLLSGLDRTSFRNSPSVGVVEKIVNPNLLKFEFAYLGMAASAGMMQAMIKAAKKDKAVRINFVLGFSSQDDIRHNGVCDSRDMLLPFEGIIVPKTVHKVFWSYLEASYHDFLHAFNTTIMYANHRHLNIIVSDHIAAHSSNQSRGKIAEMLQDMDMEPYFPFPTAASRPFANLQEDPDAFYWVNLFIVCKNEPDDRTRSAIIKLFDEMVDFLLISHKSVAEAHGVSEKGFRRVCQSAKEGIVWWKTEKDERADFSEINENWNEILTAVQKNYTAKDS